jgi:enediyne biosynthesis protein E4
VHTRHDGSRTGHRPLQAILLAAASLLSARFATAGPITFHDVAHDPAYGIDYQRYPSTTDALAEALRQSGPHSIVDLLLGPLKEKGAPGVALLDYDGDGDLDIYVTNGPGHANGLYKNLLKETGQMRFVSVPDAAGAAATDQDSTGVCFGDIDNDGDPDLLVLGRAEPPRLFENRGGHFVDITGKPGSDLGRSHYTSSGCAMADVNNDGLLDLFIGNTFDWSTKQAIIVEPFALNQPLQLFLNRGGNVFEDVSATSGINGPQNHINWAVAMFDYDGDGNIDILLAQDQGAIPPARHGGVDRGLLRLLKGDGTGHFADVTEEAGLHITGDYMGFAVADYDGDGTIDFAAANVGDYLPPFVGEPGYERGDQTSRWFLQNGDGTFRDPGLPEIGTSGWWWGCSALDYDNDGDFDIVGYGALDTGPLVDKSNPGSLLENDGYGHFHYNFAPLQTAADHRLRDDHGLAVGDLNGDGFTDIVSVSTENSPPGALPNLAWPTVWGFPYDQAATWVPTWHPTGNGDLWAWSGVRMLPGNLAVEINSGGNGNGWIDVRTLGTKGLTAGGVVNRDGVGAIVSAKPERGRRATRPVLAGSSHASQDELSVHFGLGRSRSATVDVVWPQTRVRNRLYDVLRGERVRFPEIPCSFDGRWRNLGQYDTCVSRSLDDLRQRGVLTRAEVARFRASALRAFGDRGDHDDGHGRR